MTNQRQVPAVFKDSEESVYNAQSKFELSHLDENSPLLLHVPSVRGSVLGGSTMFMHTVMQLCDQAFGTIYNSESVDRS